MWAMHQRPVAVSAGHEGKVTGLALLPNDLVLSCSEDRSLRIWDLKSMKQLHVSPAEMCAGHGMSLCACSLPLHMVDIAQPTMRAP
jgi:WD40 repeat protein